MKLLYYSVLTLALFSCGQRRSLAAGEPNRDPSEVVKMGQIPGSALSIGVVVNASKGQVLLLSRLKTKPGALPITLSEGETTILLETDASFPSIRSLLYEYASKQSFVVSSSEGAQPATVAGVALTTANCGADWAAYQVLVTQPLQESDEVVIARIGEAPPSLTSRRLLGVSDSPPEEVQKTIERLSPKGPSREQRLWSRLMEIDGDSGAEIVVARLLFEPLTSAGSREAAVQSFWLDEARGAWSVLSKSEREIAQEDLLRFSPDHHWERWGAPPVLVVDLENDKIAEVVRAAADGYSLWRVDAGALQQISFASLASQERCE